MKLIPLLLVVSAIAALAPTAIAQDSLNRGKGDDKRSSSDRSRDTNRGRTAPPPSDKSRGPSNDRGRGAGSDPVNINRGRSAQDGGGSVDHGRGRASNPDGDRKPVINDRGSGNSARPGGFGSGSSRESSSGEQRGLFNYRSPQDPLNRGKGNGNNGGNSGPRPSNPQPRGPEPRQSNGGGDDDRSPDFGRAPSQSPLSRAPQTRDSRSGAVRYTGTNNQFGNRSDRVVAPTIPNDTRVARGSLRQPQARSRDDRRWDDDRSNNWGWRSGYWQYNRDWRDSYFSYPHYRFAYTNYACPSPWYGYVNLPAYIDPARCVNTVSINFGWGLGIRYTWSSYNDYSRRGYYRTYDRYYTQPVGYGDLDLDYAVSGIQNGFRNRDLSQFDTLLPRNSSVYVDLGDRPGYSLRSDDFYDMLNDVINATNTQSYSIVEVFNNGRESTVVADHRFVDAWGGTVTQRHWFGLTRDRYGYRIVSFRSSARY